MINSSKNLAPRGASASRRDIPIYPDNLRNANPTIGGVASEEVVDPRVGTVGSHSDTSMCVA
jgi:hypothetical protein